MTPRDVVTLAELMQCASNWEPDVRLVGPVRADDIRVACSHALQDHDRVAVLETLAAKVDAIRNSIVGAQTFNWSEHAYPLVAALGEAGYPGEGYAIARKNLGTLTDRVRVLEAALHEIRRLLGTFAGTEWTDNVNACIGVMRRVLPEETPE